MATTELHPCAILPNGPPCTKAGFHSKVWTRLGLNASFNNAVMAPWAFTSLAKTNSFCGVCPTLMFPNRRCRSCISVARHNTAMTSEAAVMSKFPSLAKPFTAEPSPVTIWRNDRSFISMIRRQLICRASREGACPQYKWLSTIAASRLCAEVMAWKSPVKCKLMSVIGTTWAYPPPHAPPFIPKHGPKLGSRKATITFFPIFARPSVKPTDVVVLPSPAGVGVMAVININFPSGLSFKSPGNENGILALYFP